MIWLGRIFFINSKKNNAGIYNIGFENKSILNIAKDIRNKIATKIEVNKKVMIQEVID